MRYDSATANVFEKGMAAKDFDAESPGEGQWRDDVLLLLPLLPQSSTESSLISSQELLETTSESRPIAPLSSVLGFGLAGDSFIC